MSRKRRMKTKLKRCFAMFLSLCIMFSMFQGVAWADTGDGRDEESPEILIKLDGDAFMEEAENAVRSGSVFGFECNTFWEKGSGKKLRESELYSDLFDPSTGIVYAMDDVPISNWGDITETGCDFQISAFIKMGSFDPEQATGSNARRATAGNASKKIDLTEDYAIEEYTLTGSETIIFFFVNMEDRPLNFVLDLDGRRSGVIKVESGSSLAANSQVKEKEVLNQLPAIKESAAAAPSIPETLESTAAETETGESKTETMAPEESASQGTETTETESSVSEEITTAEESSEEGETTVSEGTTEVTGTEESKSDQEDDTVVSDSSDGETAATEAEGETDPTEEETSPIEESEEETESEDPTEDAESETADAAGDEEGSQEENEAAQPEGDSDNQDSGLTAQISIHKTYRVAVPNEGDIDERDMAEPDSENVEEGFEEDEGWNEALEEEYSEDEASYENLTLAIGELPTVLMTYGTNALSETEEEISAEDIEMALFDAMSSEISYEAVTMSASAFYVGKEVESPFRVTLYDYSGTGARTKDPKWDAADTINEGYLHQTDSDNGVKKENEIYFGDNSQYAHSAWEYSYRGGTTNNVNIYQGIVSELNKDNVDYPYPTGANLWTNLFPSPDDSVDEEYIKTYTITNPGNLFAGANWQGIPNNDGIPVTNNEGYYVYNSRENPVKYVKGTSDSDRTGTLTKLYRNNWTGYNNAVNAQVNLDGGFWPFGNTNYYHGMHLGFDFYLLEDGMTNRIVNGTVQKNSNGDVIRDNMKFSFSGDDDVWVFLTEISANGDISESSTLALDLGGNHNSMDGTIDFATGEITYEKTLDKNGNLNGNGAIVHYWDNKTDTYKSVGEHKEDATCKAYLYTIEDWKKKNPGKNDAAFNAEFPLGAMGLERKALAQYRLDMFYLERGGTASNCLIQFNLPAISPGVTVAKQVIADQEGNFKNKLNGTYKFNLYNNANEKLNTEPLEITVKNGFGSGTFDVKLEKDNSYYVEEVTNDGAVRTEWSIPDTEGNQLQSGTTTPGENGYLLCTNIYGNIEASVHKRAVLLPTDEETEGQLEHTGKYNLELSVDGNNIVKRSADGTEVKQSLKEVTAYDTLSEHVNFELGSDNLPQIELVVKEEGKEPVTPTLTGSRSGGSIVYLLQNQEIVRITGKKIVWNVTTGIETLPKGTTKTLVIKVNVTSPYQAEYTGDGTGMPDADTGTHSGSQKAGYYSNTNVDCKVTYKTELLPEKEETKDFPKPIVFPRAPQSASVTITKTVNNLEDARLDELADTEFPILITSDDVYADEYKAVLDNSTDRFASGDSIKYPVFLYSDTGTIEVKEDLTELTSFELESISIKDNGKTIEKTETGDGGYTFPISPGSNIEIVVTNRYKNPVQIQKLVNDRTDGTVPFDIQIKEGSVPHNEQIAPKDGAKKVDGLSVPNEGGTVTYVISEPNLSDDYILEKVEAENQSTYVTGAITATKQDDGTWIVTAPAGSRPLIKVYNKTKGKIRVQKVVETETGVTVPEKEFMIQVNSVGNGSYVDAGAVLKNGESSGWIVIDKDTELKVSETELKEFDLKSIEFRITDLSKAEGEEGRTKVESGSQYTVKPGEEVTIVVTNKYHEKPYFDADDGEMNDFNDVPAPDGSAQAQPNEVEFLVERRFLTTEGSPFILEPRELPERLL